MAREHLARRANWQGKGVARGQGAEHVFSTIMGMHLDGTSFQTEHKPKDLKGIYGTRIANGKERPHGIEPEFLISNRNTGRRIYVEIKRQRASGNAHERACKLAMPGVVRSACQIANQPEGIVPFWWIFTNGLATDQWYRQEIMHWFQGMEANVLLWPQVLDRQAVIRHFEVHIRPLLE